MDITAAKLGAKMAINSLAASRQIGSATKPMYTYNGDPNNLVSSEVLNELYGSPMTFIKVSDVVHDLNTIVFAKAHTWAGEVEYAEFDLVDSYEPLMAMFGIYHPEDGSTRQGLICMAVNEEASAMIGLACGTYLVVSLEDDYYPTYIEFAETIKPIDPKYLPIGKSIDLDNYGNGLQSINAVIVTLAIGDTGGGTFTYENGMEQFWADVLAKQPDYLIFRIYGNEVRVTVGGLYATEAALQEGSAAISAVGLLTLYGMSVMGNFVLTQEGEAGLKISVKANLVEFPDNVLEM